jgi:hypothetical protein
VLRQSQQHHVVVDEGIRLAALDGPRALRGGRDGDQKRSRPELGDVPLLHGAADHRDPSATEIGELFYLARPRHENQRRRHEVRVRELRQVPTLGRRRDRGGQQVNPSCLQDLEPRRRGDGHELDAPVIVEEDPREESRQVNLEADPSARRIERAERGRVGLDADAKYAPRSDGIQRRFGVGHRRKNQHDCDGDPRAQAATHHSERVRLRARRPECSLHHDKTVVVGLRCIILGSF